MEMRKKFDEIFEDCTKLGTKIKTDEYHSNGKHPIIDQGQEMVAGFTDLEDGLFDAVPAIVFGDHTRIIKYVDYPFFLGADGVKVLRSKVPNANYRYLYYALKNAKIPNTGYNRHYKWLKELEIEYPPISQQIKTVKVLDEVESIIHNRQNQLQKLDELVKARFVELFGDPILNQKQFPVYRMDEVVEFQGGSQPDKKFFEYEPTDDNIRLIQIRDYKTDKFITYIPRAMAKRFCTADDIMIGRYGPPIFQILQGIEGSFNVALMKATPKKGNKEFVRQFLKQECLLDYLEGMSKRTAGQDGIQMDKLKAYPFPLPPVELQNQFEKFANQVDKSKLQVPSGNALCIRYPIFYRNNIFERSIKC